MKGTWKSYASINQYINHKLKTWKNVLIMVKKKFRNRRSSKFNMSIQISDKVIILQGDKKQSNNIYYTWAN